jgi:hypothetical protein
MAMYWYRKTFPRFGAEWAGDQDTFETMQFKAAADGTDAHQHMFMIAVASRPRTMSWRISICACRHPSTSSYFEAMKRPTHRRVRRPFSSGIK